VASYGAPVLAVFDLGVLLCQEQANVEAGMDIRDATVDDAAAIARIYNQGIEDRVATLETQVRTPEERAEWLRPAAVGSRGRSDLRSPSRESP